MTTEKSTADRRLPEPGRCGGLLCGYVRMALQGGMLHTTSPRGEGYLAYKRPGQKLSLRAMLPLAKGFLGAMDIPSLVRFTRIMAQGGPGLDKRLDREKKPYIFVGLVCVRQAYQGQGYMRKVMEIAFAEGDRLGIPVILETDARSKRQIPALGMKLAGTRRFGTHGLLYDLIRYPENKIKTDSRRTGVARRPGGRDFFASFRPSAAAACCGMYRKRRAVP